MPEITIRTARETDEARLRRLAALDSQRLPAGDLLVAELGGEIQAALAPASQRAVANPFKRTAGLVELLRVYATSTRPEPAGVRRRAYASPRLA